MHGKAGPPPQNITHKNNEIKNYHPFKKIAAPSTTNINLPRRLSRISYRLNHTLGWRGGAEPGLAPRHLGRLSSLIQITVFRPPWCTGERSVWAAVVPRRLPPPLPTLTPRSDLRVGGPGLSDPWTTGKWGRIKASGRSVKTAEFHGTD